MTSVGRRGGDHQFSRHRFAGFAPKLAGFNAKAQSGKDARQSAQNAAALVLVY
jgi:hypothetical protein